jgi:hypothetical protein
MSSARKVHFVRTVLNPKRMPDAKTIPPAKLAELARRTAAWEAKPQKPSAK